MNTLQLECFVQVAQNLNFRRAAGELHLSQPTVSKQVASLEDELGGSLFARSTRQVMLTDLGEAFLPDAKEILRLTYASTERARNVAGGFHLALGYSDPNELARLSVALRRLRRENAGLSVSLRLGSRDGNIEQLARGRMDAVLGFRERSLEIGGVAFEALLSDELVCLARSDSPLAQLGEVGEDNVAGLPQVVCLPLGLRRRGYAAQGHIPRTDEAHLTRCLTTSEAICLVKAVFGYALVPSVAAGGASGLAVLPWRGAPRIEYGAYVRADAKNDVLERFLDAARLAYGRGAR